jgi:two-component system, OmpR family, sensor histidine kinase KdpD
MNHLDHRNTLPRRPQEMVVFFRQHLRKHLIALSVTGICTAVAFPFYPNFNITNIAMLYLLGTTFVALRLGRGPAVLMSVVNIIVLDYLFIPPLFSFEIDDMAYFFTLGVTLIVAITIANLVVTIRRHSDDAVTRERRSAVLYAMSRELCVAPDADTMAAVVVRHICELFQVTAMVLPANEQGELEPLPSADSGANDSPTVLRCCDLQVAQKALLHGQRIVNDAVYVPLQGSHRGQGVLIVCPRVRNGALPAEQLNLLDAFAAQLALALQRARSAEVAELAHITAERALLRNTLLASISHDLRTPLSAIAGAGSLIALPDYVLNLDRRMTLGQLIERKARDMSNLVSNILKLAEMEFGDGALRTDWHAVEDLISHSLRSNEVCLSQHRVLVNLPAEPPLILAEATLIVQILNNLLENAAKYTRSGTTIEISAVVSDAKMVIVVADNGPGLPPGDPERLFEKFQRGRIEGNVVGVGLGLAICRAAARLHGGDIHAMSNPGGGARFELRLPVKMLNYMLAASELDDL